MGAFPPVKTVSALVDRWYCKRQKVNVQNSTQRERGLLPMFYLELVSGLRKGELTALLWSDLDVQSRTIVNLHKKILKDAGLPHIRFHDLRHTFATLALQNGVGQADRISSQAVFSVGISCISVSHTEGMSIEP